MLQTESKVQTSSEHYHRPCCSLSVPWESLHGQKAGCEAPFSDEGKAPSLIGNTAAPLLPLQREGHSVISEPAALLDSGAKPGTCSLSLSALLGGFYAWGCRNSGLRALNCRAVVRRKEESPSAEGFVSWKHYQEQCWWLLLLKLCSATLGRKLRLAPG